MKRYVKSATSTSSINQIFEQIKDDIESVMQEPAYQHEGEDWQVGLTIAENIVDKYIKQLSRSFSIAEEELRR